MDIWTCWAHLMDMCRHFILANVYMIFYHLNWNFIFGKMTDMKAILTLSFKHTCALIITPTSLCLFISFRVNYVHMKISCRFEISFNQKTDMKSILFWFSFCLDSLSSYNYDRMIDEITMIKKKKMLFVEYHMQAQNVINY